MNRRSSSKQNLNSSYYDLTSPLSNLSNMKQKSLLKSSIQNSFLGKLQMYSQNDSLNSSKSSLKSQANYVSLKAGSQVYQLPEFTVPEINYQISQAIKQKTGQIRQDAVAHLPAILSSSHSLPALVPKSANFNPKKLENVFGHRSSVLQLETWIKSSLAKGLPTSPQQLIEYKQMIMGVGMKQLIRIINLRCLQEGKLLEQVWELTWGICKEIIQHMALRARKCQDILTQQLIEFNQGCKRNYFQKDKELIQLRKKVQQYQQQNGDLKDKLEQLTKQNERIMIQSDTNFLNSNYINEEFLNVLQQNLAMYLHLGDKNKKDWIRKMYKQVGRSRDSIQKSLKQKVNKTVTDRIRHQQSFGEQDQKQLQVDQEGNFVVESQKVINQNGQVIEKQQDKDCDVLVDQLNKEFELKEAEVQTEMIEMVETEIQYEGPGLEDKQVSTQENPLEQIGVNTEGDVDSVERENKNKDGKSKKQKVPAPKSLKPKISKRGSSVLSQNFENRQSNLQPKGYSLEDAQKSLLQTVEYVCKECYVKRSKQEALLDIQFEEDEQRMRRQQSEARRNDKNGQNDSSNQRPSVRKNQTKKRTHMSPISPKDFGRDDSSNEKSLEKQQKGKLKRMFSTVEENKIVEDPSEVEADFARYGTDKDQGYLLSPIDSVSAISHPRKFQRRNSSLLHDIGIKKEIEQSSFMKEAAYNLMKSEQDKQGVVAKLPLCSKEPYFKFFTEQITEANKELINEITYQQSNNEAILNNYFNIVQEVNSVPESRIMMSEKQMLTTIEKNLMPIILELLNTVKKSVLKKTVDQTIRSFSSLPFILMNKFSTKYGVKILAIKNMKLLLSSLKKIEMTTDRYKSIRLMLFTDCRAMYSQDLFVYLLILATITPQLDIEKDISYEEVTEVREICEKYLTTEKRVYEEFDNMTKEALSLKGHQGKIDKLKLAPLLRSVITSYRMVKINRIEEVGFLFLMLKKQNYLEYLTFSYFLSCLKLETEIKVKIVKTFLANCDLRAKNKRIAISESGFSRFLIRCPEFNFESLNNAISKQRKEIDQHSEIISTKKVISTKKRISEPFCLNHQSSINNIKSLASLKNEDELIAPKSIGSAQSFESKFMTQKAILMASNRSLVKKVSVIEEKIEAENLDSNRKEQTLELKLQQEPSAQTPEVSQLIVRNTKRQFSLNQPNNQDTTRHSISQKLRHYSYFTYEISKFMENKQETKYMTETQKEFVAEYLVVHVMACEVEEMIGIIDYFSNDMLEIVCCDVGELRIGGN